MRSAIKRSLISAYFLLSAYFLTAQSYKRMHLTTRVYGIPGSPLSYTQIEIFVKGGEPGSRLGIILRQNAHS